MNVCCSGSVGTSTVTTTKKSELRNRYSAITILMALHQGCVGCSTLTCAGGTRRVSVQLVASSLAYNITLCR